MKESQEVNKELGKGDRIKFNLTGEEHKLEIKKITAENTTIELNSSAFNFTLAINESRKFNLTNSEFYDLFVKLNYIKFFKANLTIMAIHEAIFAKPVEKEKPVENITEKKEKPVEEEKEKFWQKEIWKSILGLGLFLLSILAILLTLGKIKQLSRRLKKK